MIKNSESVIFLCDHNKLGRMGVTSIGTLNGIDCFITDVQLSEDWNDALNKCEVKIITV